jgi:hypothetical protein
VRRTKIDEQNKILLDRQRNFRMAADVVAGVFMAFPEVQAVAVIGSVAKPLWKEVPRFKDFREQGIELWHECGDLDLAVWLTSQHRLDELRRTRDLALLKEVERGSGLGIAGFQVEVFLFEPASDVYLGRLCRFNQCPKGKPDCLTPGCGAIAFNKRVAGFMPDAGLLASVRETTLYERSAGRLRSALDLPAPESGT